jgi:hypothetical protein
MALPGIGALHLFFRQRAQRVASDGVHRVEVINEVIHALFPLYFFQRSD